MSLSGFGRVACAGAVFIGSLLQREDQVGDDDVGLRHVGPGSGEGGGVFGPFGGGVDRDGDAGEVLRQTARYALGGACGMGVEGDDDKVVEAVCDGDFQLRRCVAVIAHNGPLPRRGSRC